MLTKNESDLIWKIRHGLFQQLDFYMGVNIRILLSVTIVVNWTISPIIFLHAVDFQGCFN